MTVLISRLVSTAESNITEILEFQDFFCKYSRSITYKKMIFDCVYICFTLSVECPEAYQNQMDCKSNNMGHLGSSHFGVLFSHFIFK